MLVIGKEDKIPEIKEKLAEENINITVIGEVIEKGILIEKNGVVEEIPSPGSDELYKALQF